GEVPGRAARGQRRGVQRRHRRRRGVRRPPTPPRLTASVRGSFLASRVSRLSPLQTGNGCHSRFRHGERGARARRPPQQGTHAPCAPTSGDRRTPKHLYAAARDVPYPRPSAVISELKNPNFAALAEAVGLKGLRVEDPAKVRPALEEALKSSGPVLVDVV